MVGYLPEAEATASLRRRLVPHRRRRLARTRGMGPPDRPLEGDDQGQRVPGGTGRDRGGPPRSPVGPRLRRLRAGRRAGRRSAGRGRAAGPGAARHRRARSRSSWPVRWPPTSSCVTSSSSTPSRGCPRARSCAARSATSGRRCCLTSGQARLMDVRLSSEQEALRESVAQVVDRLGPGTVRELDDLERSAKLDAAVAASGWRELRVPGEGAAPLASGVEAAIVAEELGRGLADAPFLGPTLAAELRRLAGAPAATVCRDRRRSTRLALRLSRWPSTAGHPAGTVAVDARGADRRAGPAARRDGPRVGLGRAGLGRRRAPT